MTVDEFNDKYREAGGMSKLIDMKATLQPVESIAKNYGVTREAVKCWMKELFDCEYDPRIERREAIIKEMVEYAKSHTEENFYEMFKHKSAGYLQEAHNRCKAQGIY